MTTTQFKTLRKRLGITQNALAHTLHRAEITIKTWETPNGKEPPAYAWDYLNTQLNQHRQSVRRIVSEATEDNPHTITLGLYRQPDTIERMLNAQTMEAGALLDYQGYTVNYVERK